VTHFFVDCLVDVLCLSFLVVPCCRYNKLKKKLEHLRVTQNKQYTRQQENTACNVFYARVKNLSNVKFSKEEINIFETGHNYALEPQPKHYLRDPIIDTENAIQEVDSKLHNVYMFMASKNSTNHIFRYSKLYT
jgi:hypothetical protein